MMWSFKDKGERDVCLIPEVTGIIQEMWRDEWSKDRKSLNVFYTQRCYRYERPQRGRYREFTQFGIEMLGQQEFGVRLAKGLLKNCLERLNVKFSWEDQVKRGLNYYVEDGFEASVESLGAQKQVAGGGAYAEGVGWAVGVDRLMLAVNGV
jgi:histidyl-tRNA synthetase